MADELLQLLSSVYADPHKRQRLRSPTKGRPRVEAKEFVSPAGQTNWAYNATTDRPFLLATLPKPLGQLLIAFIISF